MGAFTFSGSQKSLNKMLARLPSVQAELEVKQEEIAAKAAALLMAHFEKGEHDITTSKGKVDHYINLEGPAALSVEVGHFDGYKGKRRYVEGLHVLTKALL